MAQMIKEHRLISYKDENNFVQLIVLTCTLKVQRRSCSHT